MVFKWSSCVKKLKKNVGLTYFSMLVAGTKSPIDGHFWLKGKERNKNFELMLANNFSREDEDEGKKSTEPLKFLKKNISG